MKQVSFAVLAALAALSATPAAAEDTLVPAGGGSLNLRAALGKQIDVRFSESFAKDRLTSPDAARLVETAVRDHFDHFLADHMERGRALLGFVLDRMDERLKRRQEREIKRSFVASRSLFGLIGDAYKFWRAVE